VPTGTIMIAALTFLIGFQLVLSFLNYDISASPREPLHPFLMKGWQAKAAAPEKAEVADSDQKGEPARRKA
jgi:dolichol-phosphate mannosyltransferase